MDIDHANAEALVSEYLALRAKRAELKREYEVQDAELEAKMGEIEGYMKAIIPAGATSMRTPAGTIMLQERVRYWPSDWAEMYKFIDAHKAYHLLEKRVHAGNMKAFMEENPGELPPGLNIDREVKAVVRVAN
jgi:hypothetical protein